MFNMKKSDKFAKLKVTYLITLSLLLFFIHNKYIIIGLIAFQILIWLFSKISFKPLIKSLIKLKWFFLIIIISYTLLPPSDNAIATTINLHFFTVDIYFSGLTIALLMLSRISLMVMASIWIRLSTSQLGFISALRTFKIPESIAIIIDLSLKQVMTEKKPKHRKTEKAKKPEKNKKTKITFKELKLNKFKFINTLIEKNIQKSDNLLIQNYPEISQTKRKDILVILTVVVAIMSLKFLQLMPGLPIAPGHKNLLVIPLIILASLSTHMKNGGLAAGFATGIVSFLMGFGKFGIFEVFHFALPGLVSDWLYPLIKNNQGNWLIVKLAIIGAILGFTRFVANILILLLVGTPQIALIVMTPMLISQIVFGALSSIICVIVIKKHNNGGWF